MRLEAEILQWAQERNIIGVNGKATVVSQHLKTLEEVHELTMGLYRKDTEAIKDAIGDIIVTLVIQAHFHGLVIDQCVAHAYDQIKNRRGTMKDGQFVKEVQK